MPEHEEPEETAKDREEPTEEPTKDYQSLAAEVDAPPSHPPSKWDGIRAKLRGKRQGNWWNTILHDPRYAVIGGILATFFSDQAGLYIAASFVLIPMVMGGVCAYFWQEAKLSKPAYFLYGLLNTITALTISYLFLKEGIICLIMASPLLLIFILIGSLIGREIFKARHKQLNISLAPIVLALLIGDSLMPHNFHNEESDRIVIHASPQRVWQYIIDYPANTTHSDYWLARLGMPVPLQSTSSGHEVGATRRCLFTKNIAFDEKLTVVEPGRKLTFEVTTQPNDSEVVNHIVLEKGQFDLQDNGDGTTTVIGTSWYKLNVYPICYYDLWVQDVVRHVHLRVMQHIKTLAERPELPPQIISRHTQD